MNIITNMIERNLPRRKYRLGNITNSIINKNSNCCSCLLHNNNNNGRLNNHNIKGSKNKTSDCTKFSISVVIGAGCLCYILVQMLLSFHISTLLLQSLSTVSTTTTTTEFSSMKAQAPFWIPHHLTPNEVLTGQFTDQCIYTGIYQFNHSVVQIDPTTATSVASNDIHQYQIYFPVNYDVRKQNDSTEDIRHRYGNNYDESETTTYLITHKGDKGHDSPNQDRSIVIQPPPQNHIRNDDDDDAAEFLFLAALFDGHGDLGHVTSHVAVNDLPLLLLQQLHQAQTTAIPPVDGKTSETTTETTTAIFPQLINDVFRTIDSDGIIAQVPRGGSTAVLVLQFQSLIYIASVGDSTAYCIQWFTTTATTRRSSIDEEMSDTKPKTLPYSIIKSAIQHKPGDPMERKRIEDNGGHVYIPPADNSHESSRVVYTSYDKDSGKQMQTGLAMSRSLGDTTAKELRVVTSIPDIVTVELPPPRTSQQINGAINDHYFVILASDGIMDVTELNDLIIPIGTALFEAQLNVATKTTISKSTSTSSSSSRLHTVCHGIVQSAIESWGQATGHRYRDDMSLVVHRIR